MLEVTLGSVTRGGGACASVAWVSDTELLCTVPAGYGGPHDVTVVVGDQQVVAQGMFAFEAPLVSAVVPSFLAFTGMEVVEIHGANFFPMC